jgi:hypothetical protein
MQSEVAKQVLEEVGCVGKNGPRRVEAGLQALERTETRLRAPGFRLDSADLRRAEKGPGPRQATTTMGTCGGRRQSPR